MTHKRYIGLMIKMIIFASVLTFQFVTTAYAQTTAVCPSKLMYANPFSYEDYKGFVGETGHVIDASDAMALQVQGFIKQESETVYIPFIHLGILSNGNAKCTYGYDFSVYTTLIYPKPEGKECFKVNEREIQCVYEVKVQPLPMQGPGTGKAPAD